MQHEQGQVEFFFCIIFLFKCYNIFVRASVQSYFLLLSFVNVFDTIV